MKGLTIPMVNRRTAFLPAVAMSMTLGMAPGMIPAQALAQDGQVDVYQPGTLI